MSLLIHLHHLSFRLFPGVCQLCGDISGQPLEICNACERYLPKIICPCPRCGLPKPDDNQEGLCGQCLIRPPIFDACIAPFSYQDSIRQLHHRFKFKQDMAAGQLLSGLLVRAVQLSGTRPDLLVPVPLHWRRRLQRGFNQADSICSALHCQLKIKMLPALKRIQNTAPQQSLSQAKRSTNVTRAFSLRSKSVDLVGKHLALIDDICTTGATAAHAARVLVAAGASRVDVWCLARTIT